MGNRIGGTQRPRSANATDNKNNNMLLQVRNTLVILLLGGLEL